MFCFKKRRANEVYFFVSSSFPDLVVGLNLFPINPNATIIGYFV